jgi:hypothetical protein
MTEERFEKLLRETAREYNEPPETPREAIWERIAAARQVPASPRARGLGLAEAAGLARWRWWPAAAAVTLALALGVVIGRLGTSADSGAEHAPFPGRAESGAAGAEDSGAGDRRAQLYAQAATPYLSRVETLLTLVQGTGEANAAAVPVADWAQDLLAETRLLLDSPAQQDEGLRRLLEDLELVLVQIVRLSDETPAGDGRWVRDSIRQRSILGRLRQRTPAGQPGSTA